MEKKKSILRIRKNLFYNEIVNDTYNNRETEQCLKTSQT